MLAFRAPSAPRPHRVVPGPITAASVTGSVPLKNCSAPSHRGVTSV